MFIPLFAEYRKGEAPPLITSKITTASDRPKQLTPALEGCKFIESGFVIVKLSVKVQPLKSVISTV